MAGRGEGADRGDSDGSCFGGWAAVTRIDVTRIDVTRIAETRIVVTRIAKGSDRPGLVAEARSAARDAEGAQGWRMDGSPPSSPSLTEPPGDPIRVAGTLLGRRIDGGVGRRCCGVRVPAPITALVTGAVTALLTGAVTNVLTGAMDCLVERDVGVGAVARCAARGPDTPPPHRATIRAVLSHAWRR